MGCQPTPAQVVAAIAAMTPQQIAMIRAALGIAA